MRAAYMEDVGQMVIRDVPAPVIENDDQLLVKVKTVGVCGSEVHAYQGSHPFRKPPVILGHEMSGEVLAVGPAVRGFRAGDRVLVDPLWTCETCAYCLAGDNNLCPERKVLGTQSWRGAFGEQVVIPESAVFSLPDELSFVQGSLVEPLAIAVHVAHRAGLKAGQSVAMLGTGSIGGMVTGLARAWGANPVIAADINPHCLNVARERLGATHDILLPDDDLVAKSVAAAGGEGVDVVFICADDPSLVNRGIEMAKRRASIVLVALLTEEPLSFMGFDIIAKELEMLGCTSSNRTDMQEAIELVRSGRVDVEAIATHILPIEEAKRGMWLAETKQDGAIKVLLSFDSAIDG